MAGITSDRRRLRVFFVNCPHLDHLAAMHLLLSENEHQKLFEFEMYNFWVPAERLKLPFRSSWRKQLLRITSRFRHRWSEGQYRAMRDLDFAPEFATELGLDRATDIVSTCIARHDQWLQGQSTDYGNWRLTYGPAVVITETPIHSDWLSMIGENMGVVTIAGWNRRFSPPSVLEFILSNVQRAALRMLVATEIGCHYPTRGCVWDFTATVEDARVSVASGYLCATCKDVIAKTLRQEQVEDVEAFLRNDWIGSVDDSTSVASDLKRIFGYDLSRTRGLSPSFWERVGEAVSTKALEKIVLVVVTLILSALLTFLGIQFGRRAHPNHEPPSPSLKLLGRPSARPLQPRAMHKAA